MKTVCYIFFFLSFFFSTQAQKSLAIITPSPYSLADQLIIIENRISEKINVPAKGIEVIDNRYDNSKLGFYPIYKTAPKLIIFSQPFPEWFRSQFINSANLQNDSTREIVFVIQRFWFGNYAEQKFTPFRQHLLTMLYYKVELFSRINDSYFPLK